MRRWLRRACDPGHKAWLRAQGIEHTGRLDADVLVGRWAAHRTGLGEALQALAARRSTPGSAGFGRHSEAWALIGVFTGGRLLAGVTVSSSTSSW